MAAKAITEKNGLVMSGYLYYKTKKMSLCHKYWAELHRETSNHPRELRLFQSKSKADNNNLIFESIVLNNILELCDKQRSISGRPMFQIMSMKMRYQLCAENREELNHWVEAIRQELFGLPQAGIIYDFMVMVIDNPSAKKYSLVGRYTLKVDDKNVMLYSANGLIPTNFLVPITHIWRVKLAPSSKKDSIYSNFVVLDIMGGDVLLLMSTSSTDIARIVSHRRRLSSGYKHYETTDEGFYHRKPWGGGKKAKTTPVQNHKSCVCVSCGSPMIQRQNFEFEMPVSHADDKQTYPVFNTNLSNERPQASPPEYKWQSKTDFTAVRFNESPNANKYPYGTISNRPPQPIPRSPKSLHHNIHICSQPSTLNLTSLQTPLTGCSENDSDDDKVASSPNRTNYIQVFNDEDSYSDGDDYVNEKEKPKHDEDLYFVSNDEILKLRKHFKPTGSIKGSKSMECLLYV